MAMQAGPSSERPGVRLALFYAAAFIVNGIQLPYLPVWLSDRGLSATQIAVIVGAPALLRLIVTPSLGMLGDRTRAYRKLVICLCALATAATLCLPASTSFAAILVLVLVLLPSMQSIMPIVDTITINKARVGLIDYGQVRMWGSVAFIGANVGFGFLIAANGPQVIALGLAAAALLTLAMSLALPADDPVVTARDTGAMRSSWLGHMPESAGAPWYLIFLGAVTLIQASHGVFYGFGSIAWRAHGLSSGWIGALWGLGVAAEVALFAVAKRLPQAWKGTPLIMVGALAGVVRWGGMALGPPELAYIPLQLLHGLSFGATHLGAMHVLSARIAPSEAAFFQAITATVTGGLGLGLSILVAGPLYDHLGIAAYGVMAALAIAGGAMTLLLMRLSSVPVAGSLATRAR